MRTALVFGYYGKDNVGDDAMLQVIAAEFKRLGIKTIAVSHNPAKTKRDFGIDAISQKANLRKLKYDFFVLGGGTQVQDYRLRGFQALLNYFIRAKKPGVKTCLLSIGVAKLKTKKGKQLARKLCKNSDLIIIRDCEGKTELRKAGVKKRMFVSADLTFALSKKPRKAVHRAICFCPIPYYEIYEKKPAKDKALAKEIAKAIDLVADETGARIAIVPFFKKYDTRFAKGIFSQLENKRTRLWPYRALGLSLSRVFEGFDVIVGMRFHSLVFSAFLGKPFIAIAFTSKTKNLVNALGWQCFAVGKGFKAETLARKTIGLYEKREAAAKKLLAKRKPLHKRSTAAFTIFKKRLLKSF